MASLLVRHTSLWIPSRIELAETHAEAPDPKTTYLLAATILSNTGDKGRGGLLCCSREVELLLSLEGSLRQSGAGDIGTAGGNRAAMRRPSLPTGLVGLHELNRPPLRGPWRQ